MEEAVRWNIKVSNEVDLALRTFLGSQGMRKGDLSKFIEQAVRAHLFHCTVQHIKARNANTRPGELQALIDDAVKEVRAGRRAKNVKAASPSATRNRKSQRGSRSVLTRHP
jgi:hypothetical protein